jgi:hypothetical protein
MCDDGLLIFGSAACGIVGGVIGLLVAGAPVIGALLGVTFLIWYPVAHWSINKLFSGWINRMLERWWKYWGVDK